MRSKNASTDDDELEHRPSRAALQRTKLHDESSDGHKQDHDKIPVKAYEEENAWRVVSSRAKT